MILKRAKKIIEEAVNGGIQDIYFLPKKDKYDLRFRSSAGNILSELLDIKEATALISHFKYLSGMNVGEKRRTQLGSCLYEFTENKSRRLRLSTTGDAFGFESLVIRLLYQEEDTPQFWFEGKKQAEKMINRRGLYLFSGPVGSGKTTLMYLLAHSKFDGRQVISIEDPVEIIQDDFLQLQINESIGNDYDNLIKLSLRHMPDLVIVGEIRDAKTARAVIRASLTGYTVFSTIHARSIRGVYHRLLELGIKRDELDNCLSAITYQRLIGGRVLIDLETEDFFNHGGGKWNEQLTQLFEGGHISLTQKKAEEISP
ncbi:competence type IV pilus ATPase ComGA [Streptococcaceae bacterium ESL0687]|nr:competence type IV pilus ATPase ComGA [Streptococcaceae bacterium ESL0687]